MVLWNVLNVHDVIQRQNKCGENILMITVLIVCVSRCRRASGVAVMSVVSV